MHKRWIIECMESGGYFLRQDADKIVFSYYDLKCVAPLVFNTWQAVEYYVKHGHSAECQG